MQHMREDRWIPVGLEDQFAPESSHPVVLDGFGVAVWRSRDGIVHVWEDRCPHRGMRLSFGFVRGETLTCLYHGWQYAGSGQCRKIPAHPDLDPPKTICAKTFPTRAYRGIVYTNLADDPAGDFADEAAGGWSAVRSIYLPLGIEAVRDWLSTDGHGLGRAAEPGMNGCHEFRDPDLGRVCLALQPVETDKTAIHVVCDTPDPAARMALARRIVRMRRQLDPA